MTESAVQQLRFVAQGFLASRIWVGIVVGSIYALSMPVAVASPLQVMLFMIGFSTIWATYLANVYTDKAEDQVNKAGIHVAVSKPLISLLALSPIPLVFDIMGWRGLIFLSLFFFVCMAYSMRFPYSKLRIKDVFLLKNIYPGLVVVCGMAALRLLLNFPLAMMDMLLIFLIYFGNEILWDIRDMKGDFSGSTLPQRIGVNPTKALIVSIYLMVLALYVLYWPFLLSIAWLPILTVILVTLKVQPNRYPMLFHLPVMMWAGFLGLLLCL